MRAMTASTGYADVCPYASVHRFPRAAEGSAANLAVAILRWMYALKLKLTDGGACLSSKRRLVIRPGLVEPCDEALHLNGTPARRGSVQADVGPGQ